MTARPRSVRCRSPHTLCTGVQTTACTSTRSRTLWSEPTQPLNPSPPPAHSTRLVSTAATLTSAACLLAGDRSVPTVPRTTRSIPFRRTDASCSTLGRSTSVCSLHPFAVAAAASPCACLFPSRSRCSSIALHFVVLSRVIPAFSVAHRLITHRHSQVEFGFSAFNPLTGEVEPCKVP